MPDNVDVLEVAETDSLDAVEHMQRFEEPRLLWVGQIDLSKVAGDDGLRVVAEAGDENLHMLVLRVLRLIHDDEGIVESTTTHEGQRSNLDNIGLQHLVDLLWINEIVQCVVERPKVWIDLLLKGAGKET